MESQLPNPEFRPNPENFTHAHVGVTSIHRVKMKENGQLFTQLRL